MKSIVSSIKYRISYQFKWIVWSLLVYLIAMFLVFYGLIKFSLINSHSGSLVYRLSFFILTLFAFTMRFKEDFDFLLTMSNTRNTIFLAMSAAVFILSIFCSSLIVVERLIVDLLNTVLNFKNMIDPFYFFAAYATDNLLLQFFFFLMLSCFVSMSGLFLGSLFYRFGKIFTLFFWLVFSAVPTLSVPLLLWLFHQHGQLSGFIADAGEFLGNFDLAAGSGYLLILTVITVIAAYLNIRKLPQK